ncbi:MAG: class I SAM-dependent methyltransferase [Syntrophales bacterium]|jgi:SAM-dependent methyltransferase
MPFGSEIALTPGLRPLERFYVKLFGAPILGLRVRARTILPFLDQIPNPRRIADAGCGRGMITLGCARRFPAAEVFGVDLDEVQNMVNSEIAKKAGFKKVQFVTMDAMKLPELGRFDLVISTDMLEHLDDDLGAVKMFYEALKPRGHLLVHVPHLTRHIFGWQRENWMDIDGHVRPGYTKDELTRLLTRGGLRVKACVYNYNTMETLANDISKLITGAREQNKGLYALAFPLLLCLSFLGSFYRSQKCGSGLVALAVKEA